VDHVLRIERVAARVRELDLDALFVTRLPNVRYLTGFTGSNGQALISADGDVVFFTDGRYEERSRHEVVSAAERVTYLDGIVPVHAPLAVRAARRVGFESSGLTFGAWERLGERIAPADLVPTEGVVERLRRVKERAEVDAIAGAQAAADDAFERVVLGGALREGTTERELALAVEDAMRVAGAEDKAFDTIAAFGELAAEPHHHPTDREVRRGDVVKLDFGARVDGYHCDITRTVAFGEPGQRVRELHALVAAAHRAGVEAAEPGAALRDVDAAARAVIEDASLGEAFPHGLGHGVGLEIHEEPMFHRSAEDTLPEGAVVTIEPGVYLPGLGGVRIEDTVEITRDGARPIPRTTKELVVL
jgi:Xaa-Pro aminopeptidase